LGRQENQTAHTFRRMNDFIIRPARPGDQADAYYVCLKTGDFGKDGEPFYREDPDALGRIFVGPYLAYEPEMSLILEDGQGVCGYALGAFDSRAFYDRYEKEWRPGLCRQFPADARADRLSLVSPPRLLRAGALRGLPVPSAH